MKGAKKRVHGTQNYEATCKNHGRTPTYNNYSIGVAPFVSDHNLNLMH